VKYKRPPGKNQTDQLAAIDDLEADFQSFFELLLGVKPVTYAAQFFAGNNLVRDRKGTAAIRDSNLTIERKTSALGCCAHASVRKRL
jgi:hypothetical protein